MPVQRKDTKDEKEKADQKKGQEKKAEAEPAIPPKLVRFKSETPAEKAEVKKIEGIMDQLSKIYKSFAEGRSHDYKGESTKEDQERFRTNLKNALESEFGILYQMLSIPRVSSDKNVIGCIKQLTQAMLGLKETTEIQKDGKETNKLIKTGLVDINELVGLLKRLSNALRDTIQLKEVPEPGAPGSGPGPGSGSGRG